MEDKNMDLTENRRQSGPDLIRTLACIFVVGAHFYLNMGYYDTPMEGAKMAVMTSLRWLFLTAVPLFFMLTGYFKKNKKADKAHYMALIPLVTAYVVISVGKMILYNRLYGKIYGIKEIFENLGNYQIAWYMGLYLCVFLLIPFLNKAWYALAEREQNILLGTLVFLCTIYPVFNYIAPSYFIGTYPILFYFFGIAVRDRKIRVSRLLLAGVLIITICIETFISMKFTRTGTFDWNLISTTDTYGTIFITICTLCVFLMFYEVNIGSKIICRLLSSISGVSFEIYLFAGAYDAIIYRIVKQYVQGPATEAFWYFLITVPASFICAYLSSIVFRAVVLFVMSIPSGFSKKGDSTR